MIQSIDHIVLTVTDIKRSIQFYCDILGMQLERFRPPDSNSERIALQFGNQKINLHSVDAPYTPHAQKPTPGAIDLCFLSDHPLTEWERVFQSAGVTIEQGPIRRTGATGPLRSLYVRDPDNNLIEIANSK